MFGRRPKRKVCRACREEIHAQARRCRYCRSRQGWSPTTHLVVSCLLLLVALPMCVKFVSLEPSATAGAPAPTAKRAASSDAAPTGATGPGWYYVAVPTLNVRLGPSARAAITNKEYRQSRMEVLEVRDGWARISPYYDGFVEGVSGNVARWVAAAHLSTIRPSDLPQPRIPHDPRVDGIPKVGENGLTEADVLILHSGARYFLDSGRCRRIEWGDKSVNKPNTYYVNCGGLQNLFFTPGDLPTS